MKKGRSWSVQLMEELMVLKSPILFITICALTFLILYIKKTFIIDQINAFEILEERGEGGIFGLLAGLQYISIPLIYLWKFTVYALILWLAAFVFGHRLTFWQCWQIVAAAEFIFLVPEILKILWFLFVNTDPEYWDVRAFYPLSLMNMVDYETIDSQWHYPLKSLNLFELIYWFLLVAGVQIRLNKGYKTAFLIVFCSYVAFYLLWLVYYTIVY